MTNQNNTTDKNVNLLDTVRRLHFVGIGGSGMCPMAEILHHKDYIITGSDINESDTLARIRSYGIPVHMGHRAENIGDAEVVVYTAAAKQDNPELVAARAKGIPTLERSVMLGLLTKKFANPIAVSGTHGKTTTTGMLTQILIEAGRDPSAVIGGCRSSTATAESAKVRTLFAKRVNMSIRSCSSTPPSASSQISMPIISTISARSIIL